MDTIGVLGSILGFIGVIITIIVTEISRRKQNTYEYNKEKLLNEQQEFKKTLKTQLEILDPYRIVEEFHFCNHNNYEVLDRKLLLYVSEIANINRNIFWYYTKEMSGNYEKLNKLINEFNETVEVMKNKCIKITETITYLKNNMQEQAKDEEIKENINKFVSEQKEILTEILDYRDKTLPKLQELAKEVIAEREEIIKNKMLKSK